MSQSVVPLSTTMRFESKKMTGLVGGASIEAVHLYGDEAYQES